MNDDFHNDVRAEDISEESHAQRQRFDPYLKNVQRSNERKRMCKMLQPAAETAVADPGINHQYNTHESQSGCHIQILGRRSDSDESQHVGKTKIQNHGQNIRYKPFAFFSEDTVEESAQHLHKRFKHCLLALRDNFHISCEDNGQNDENEHHQPCHNTGFRYMELSRARQDVKTFVRYVQFFLKFLR